MALAELEFIEHSEVVHFLGPPGTGKNDTGPERRDVFPARVASTTVRKD
jgi:hypothetical protein